MNTFLRGPVGIRKIMSAIHFWPASAQSNINNWSSFWTATIIVLHTFLKSFLSINMDNLVKEYDSLIP